MITLAQLKVHNHIDGWKIYDIQGLQEDDVKDIYLQLCDTYHTVEPHVGRYIGTAEYYGYFECKNLKLK